MTPAARVQAAIELLDEVIAAARNEGAAADTIIQRYFKTRRYAGSQDRRAVRELVFSAIRALGERPESGRAAMIGYARASRPDLLALFGVDAHAPAALRDDEPAAATGAAPAWLEGKFRTVFGASFAAAMAQLSARAPLDLRVNSLKAARDAVAAEIGGLSSTPIADTGLRATEPFNVEATQAFVDGRIEIQDEGSQLIAAACAARPGMTVIDLCAGAGGKTLAIAAAMANTGRLIAADTDRGRLSRLAPRAVRAGVTIIESRLLDPGHELEILGDLAGLADVVLIDAPCSGTGTWRRNPEARWRLTPERLARLTALQARLIDIAVGLLRPGGHLVYAVCSLLPEEGRGQADALETRHPDLKRWAGMPGPSYGPGRTLLAPHSHATDGFFIAGYEKSC